MLGTKGALVVDDIDANWGFRLFIRTIPGQVSWICEAAAPSRSKTFQQKGSIRSSTARPDFSVVSMEGD
jgi:hypothetical protein